MRVAHERAPIVRANLFHSRLIACVDAPRGSRRISDAGTESMGAVMCAASDAAGLAAGHGRMTLALGVSLRNRSIIQNIVADCRRQDEVRRD